MDVIFLHKGLGTHLWQICQIVRKNDLFILTFVESCHLYIQCNSSKHFFKHKTIYHWSPKVEKSLEQVYYYYWFKQWNKTLLSFFTCSDNAEQTIHCQEILIHLQRFTAENCLVQDVLKGTLAIQPCYPSKSPKI